MNPYLIIVLVLLAGRYALSLVAGRLNVRHCSPELPEEFKGWYDPDRYAESQRYLAENTRFGELVDTVMTALTVVFILAGGFGLLDRFVRSFGLHEIVTGLLFAGILGLGWQLIRLPFAIYDTFVIEEKYGFNKTSVKTFALDILKGLLLAVVIGAPVFALIQWLFTAVGTLAWAWCWAALVMIQLFLVFVSPVLILPLFNKFVPMQPGELKDSIEEYASSQDFRMKGLFTMDGSRRSTKSNAFFTGFGKFRRIALFDTLIEKHTTDELVGVLAHEIGHYKKKHVLKGVVGGIAATGIMLLLLSSFVSNGYFQAAFGISEEPRIYAGLVLFGFLYMPIALCLGIARNAVSRRWEFEADEFALSTTEKPDALVSALKKLTVDNLGNLTPHPLTVILEYTHPPMLRRIQRIRQRAARSAPP